ncbi:MAG: HEAT repeat domain-containing protein, partial [Planctomycetes bacterium]|nr:HEAT repeat domain-containing protein [Planctomycetota bacterium]
SQRATRTLRLGIGLRNWQRAPLVSELCDGKGMSVVLTHVGAKLMPALEAKLRGKDTGERQAAIYVLGQMGRTVLAHHDRTPRLVISMAGPPLYASPGPPEFTERVVKTLLPMLRHDDYFTRSMTAGNIPVTKATEPALATALFDADLGVRMLAANSLGGHGQDRILQRLQTGKGIERIRAASLRLPDFAAVNALVQGLSDKDGLVRQESAIIVGLHPEIANFANDEIKKIVVPILREALKSDDPIRRRWSIEALTTQGAHDETSVPALIAALKDKYLRGHALQALRARADKEHAEIVPAVAPFLSDPDPSRRLFAIQCVGNAGKPGLPTLLKALDHEKDRALRDWIIDYLQQQHQDERAVAALLKMADNQEDWAHAMQALLRVGEDEKFPRIVEILCKKEEPVRLTLGRMPKALASTGSRAGPALAALLKRDDLADNRRAACTLELFLTMLWADASPWTMATEQALQDRLPRLKTLMQSKDVAVRREVAATVAQIEELQKRVWFHITRRTPDRQRRDEVMSVYTGNRERINDLLDLARQDTDLQVRRIARKAMRMDH